MKNILLSLSTLALFLGFSWQAQALIEIRANYGILSSSNDPATATDTNGITLPSLKTLAGIGGDIIVTPPLFPVGIGLRYESLGVSASAGGNDASVEAQRTALVVNYRIIDTLAFLGPIATLGLSHTNKIKIKVPAYSYDDTFSTTSGTSYSVGVEGGAHLLGFLIGAEAGIESITVKGGKSEAGTDFKDEDLNGTYFKVLAGFKF